MIVENPCSINKENLRISIRGYNWKNKEKFSYKLEPPYEDELILTSSRPSTISTAIFDLKPDMNVLIFKKGILSNMIIPTNNLPKIFKNERLFNNLSKHKTKKLRWIFCKAVCSNRIKIISRLNETRKNNDIKEILITMRDLDRKLINTKTKEELMGFEGNIAKNFYKALSIFSNLFDSEFKTRDRNSKDIINSLMNFTHTVLRNKIQQRLLLKGINPYHSFLHNNNRGQAYLTFDFAEFWIAYVDKIIFYSLEKGIIKKTDLRGDGRLSENATIKSIKLMNTRITNQEIDKKIDEFIGYLKGVNRFSWK